MPKYWFDHVHSIVPDPLRTAEFYQRMFGAQRVSVSEIPPEVGLLVTLKLGDTVIKLMTPRPKPLGSVSGLEHFGLRTDNIEAAVDELEQAGAQVVRRVIEEAPGIKSAFLSIDNTLIELQERRD